MNARFQWVVKMVFAFLVVGFYFGPVSAQPTGNVNDPGLRVDQRADICVRDYGQSSYAVRDSSNQWYCVGGSSQSPGQSGSGSPSIAGNVNDPELRVDQRADICVRDYGRSSYAVRDSNNQWYCVGGSAPSAGSSSSSGSPAVMGNVGDQGLSIDQRARICARDYGQNSYAVRDSNNQWYCVGGSANPPSNSSSPQNPSAGNPIASPTGPSGNSGNNSSNSNQCGNSQNVNMVVGGQGRVTPGLSNNLRSSPEVSNGNLIGSIPAGGVFSITGGPACGSGYQWWQVSYNGMTGWTASGNSSESWIEAVGSAGNTGTQCEPRTISARAHFRPARGGYVLEIMANPLPSRFEVYFRGQLVPDAPDGLQHNGYAGEPTSTSVFFGDQHSV